MATRRACPVCQGEELSEPVLVRPRLPLLACPHCGTAFLQEVEGGQPASGIYGEDYYDHWGEPEQFDRVWDMKLRTSRAYLALLELYVGPTHGSPRRLLDIGCAHGFMLEAAQGLGYEVVGIEISPAADYARARGLTVLSKTLGEADFPPERFDVVTLIDVLEHIEAPLPFLQGLHRVLRPGGVVLIMTPDVSSVAAKVMRSRWPHYKEEHSVYYSPRSLRYLLTQAGLHPLAMKPAFKYLTFDYIVRHFQKFTGGALTGLLEALRSALPDALAYRPLRFKTELLAIARKASGSSVA